MKKQQLCLLVFGAVCSVVVGQVKIGLLTGFSTTLRYLNGNCSWRITGNLGGIDFQNLEVSMGPQRILFGRGDRALYTLRCQIDDTTLLDAVITNHDIDDIPAPSDISLDDDSETLEWRHVYQSPSLPAGFELTTDINISYLVNVSDRDSGERKESLPSQETSLNISQFLDHCKRQELSVQALVNGHYSQSSSYLTNSSAPVFQSLLPSLLVVADTVSIRVLFVLEESQCLSQFTIVIDGLTLSLDVTSSHRESGQLNYDLSPHILAEDACGVRGVVYGSNDIGNSTTVDIRSPEECPPTMVEIPIQSSSVYLTQTAYRTSSTPSTGLPTLTRPKHPIIAAIVSVCVGVILLVSLISIVMVVVLFLMKRNGGEYAVAKKESPGASHSDEEKQIPSEDTADQVKPSRPAGLQYSEVESNIGDRQKKFSIKPNSEYAQIDHAETEIAGQQCEQARAEAAEQESVEPAPSEVSIDPNVVGLSIESHYDLLLAALLVIKAHWLDLGTNLDLSENFLDETETNMDTDRECLEEMLQNWLRYQEPSMEGLSKALTKMDLSPLIFDPAKKGFVFRSQDSGGGGGGSTCS